MNIVSLITGRGNNTLKDKNILPVLSKELLTYPAHSAKSVDLINHFYASSDDDNILNVASSVGYKKIKRPPELSTPTSQHIDAIFHAVKFIKEKDNIDPDILIVHLANSVTVKPQWIEQAIKDIISDPSISSVVPVYQEQSHHPYRAKTTNKDGFLETFFNFTDTEVSTNRQDLTSCYFLCHNFWVLNMKNSLFSEGGQKPWVFLGNKIKPIVVDECFDVHCIEDLKRCEEWILKNN